MRKPLRVRPIMYVSVRNVFVERAMIPLPRFNRLYDELYTVDEQYPLITSEERSMSQHRGYFAQVKEAWKNLAEEFDGRFPSAEHLREWALCQAGYCTLTEEIYSTPKDALQAAKSIRKASPYAQISVHGPALVVKYAMSQSVPAMKKEAFQASSKAVLEIVASMSRTTPAELRKNAGRAA
jgi:hypothetical protein